jgi:lipid A 3-O-deacylase
LNILKPVVAATLVLLASEATAQDSFVSEVRGGISFEGVELDEDLLLLPTTIPLDRPHKLSFELLFGSPDMELFKWIGAPRPVIGATISLTGRESWASAGLSWHIPVFDTPIFVEGTLGAAVHDGYLVDAPPGQKNFGCRTLIYEQVTIGANISETMTASVNFEHGSHAWLCGQTNDGFNSVGFRLGYKF